MEFDKVKLNWKIYKLMANNIIALHLHTHRANKIYYKIISVSFQKFDWNSMWVCLRG